MTHLKKLHNREHHLTKELSSRRLMAFSERGVWKSDTLDRPERMFFFFLFPLTLTDFMLLCSSSTDSQSRGGAESLGIQRRLSRWITSDIFKAMTNVAHHSDSKILKFPQSWLTGTFFIGSPAGKLKEFKSLQIVVSSHRKDRLLDFESSRRGQEVAGVVPASRDWN